jgi:hypothetical protein
MKAIAVNFPESDFPYSQWIDQTAEACAIAREAAAIAAESIATRSEILLHSLRDHDKRLELLELEIGAGVAAALTRIDGHETNELVACTKLAAGLKQISGWMVCTATSAQALGFLDPQDTRELIRMAAVLEKMLTHLGGAFSSRDIAKAAAVLPCDSEIDRLRNRFAKRHVAGSDTAQVLSMANWLQEAGNQAKALAEVICHFASGNQAFQDLITRNKPVEREFLNWLQRRESSGCRSDLGSVRDRTIRIQIQPRFRTSRGIAR